MSNLCHLLWRHLRRLQLTALLPLFASLLLAVLWSMAGLQIKQERARALELATSKSEALAEAFELRATGVLQQVAQVTQLLKFEFEQHGGESTLPILVRGGVLPASLGNMITILDAQGKPIMGSPVAASAVPAAGAAFRIHLASNSDSLYIGPPVFNRAGGHWTIELSQRLNRNDGSLAGVVIVSLPQNLLTEFYRHAELGTQSAVSLLGTDGVLRTARVGNQILAPDQPGMAVPAAVRELMSSSTVAVRADQIPRITSYRRLRDFPLVAMVGVAEAEAYARFLERRRVYLWSAGGISALILGFVALLMLLGQRLQQSNRLAHQSQATFHAVADGGLDAISILRAKRDAAQSIADFRVNVVNHRAARLLGKTRHELIGATLETLVPDCRSNGFFEKCVQVTNTGIALEEELETFAADGSPHWQHRQLIPLEDGIAITSRDISRRKRIETENRNSHNFLKSLIDYIPILVYAQSLRGDDCGRMLIWNQAAEKVSGYPARQVLGQMPAQIFPPKVARKYQKFSDDMLANPRVIDMPEWLFQRPDGHSVHLRTISVPLFDEGGTPEYLLGIAVDITARSRQELELRTKQAELAAANDSSPLGLFRTDAEGNCTYVNRAYEEMSGLTGARALGVGWARSIHPQDRLMVFQAWGRSAREHLPYHGVYRFAHDDGNIVWVSVKTAPILVDGKFLGYVGSVDDITSRRAAEKALLESEQHLRTIADALPALVAYADTDERYRFNNLAYEREFHIEREALRGKSIRELRGEALYLRAEPYIKRALAGEAVTFEIDEHRHGRYRCFDITYTPQFDNDGERRVAGFHIMSHDITAKKIQERRLVEMAQVDSLTGLLNRAGFQKKLLEAMAESRRSGILMAVIYLDIDYFKQINDNYGHLVGDALLKSFVARLSRALRSTDSVARLGGDEFTIIMENLTKPADAATIADKIGRITRPPFPIEEHLIKASVSIGLAYYQGGMQDADALLKCADDMLYQAKKAGRNTYRIAPASTNQSADPRPA